MTPNNPENVPQSAVPSGRIDPKNPGKGWRLLDEGEPLLPGDGFACPECPEYWIDYKSRPAIFTGGGKEGTWYYCPKNDTAHTYSWRRRIVDAHDLATLRDAVKAAYDCLNMVKAGMSGSQQSRDALQAWNVAKTLQLLKPHV